MSLRSSLLLLAPLALSACLAGDHEVAEVGGQLSDPCDDPQPLELIPIDVSLTDDEADLFRADCNSGGVWCNLTALRGFALPACPAEPVTLEAVFELVRQLDQDHSTLEFHFGHLLDRAGASGTSFFAHLLLGWRPGAARLDRRHRRRRAAAIEAWSVSQQVPCHNCTDFQDTLILLYPDSATVFVLDGGHGYDS